VIKRYKPVCITQKDYFLYVTFLYGGLTGLSSGIGYCIVSIIPMGWLEKKRSKFGPLIMWGASFGGLVGMPLAKYLVEKYTWRSGS
jgi:MFS family permease